MAAKRTAGNGFDMPWYLVVTGLVCAAGFAAAAHRGLRSLRTNQAIRAAVPNSVPALEADTPAAMLVDTDAEFERIMAGLSSDVTDREVTDREVTA